MESSCTGREPESLRENFVLSRMHCRMTGTQGLSVTGSNDLLSDGKWLLFLKRQAFSDWFRDAATCAPIEDKTLSKRIARSEENEVTIAIPLLEATCHSSEWLVEPHWINRNQRKKKAEKHVIEIATQCRFAASATGIDPIENSIQNTNLYQKFMNVMSDVITRKDWSTWNSIL